MPRIIPLMKRLGYSPTQRGVCFGLAAMGAQAIVREAPKPFFDRIIRIHNLTEENIESILKEKESEKTDDLFFFFDGVSVYHGLISLTEDVKKESNRVAPRQGIDNKLLFEGNNDSIENKASQNEFNLADIKEQLICSFSNKEFSQFISKLKFELKDKPFSLMINRADDRHTIQLGFSNNQWLIVDHDNVKIYDNDYVDVSEIIKEIFPSLTQRKKNRFNLHIDILLSQQTDVDLSWVKKHELSILQITKLKQNKKSLVNLINSCAFANQYQMLEKIFQHVDITSIVDEMINHDLPITMLLAEASDNYIKTTIALFEVIKKSKLSMQQRVDLLRGRCESNVDALYSAVRMGSIKTVEAFLHVIEEIELTDELRMALLKADQNSQNASALFAAAYDGHTEIVEALLESITKANFDSEKLLSLLHGKNDSIHTVMSAAIQAGHIKIIAALVQTIDSLNLSDEDKATLFESRDSRGVPALLFEKIHATVHERSHKS